MASTVRVESEGDLSVVTIARPERRNALDSATASALAQAIEDASRQTYAIVLTGAGEGFCAGGDLDELERWSVSGEDEVRSQFYASFPRMIRAIRAADAVVIAAINGAAVGAGMDLALACDLRVAAAGAKLGQVWVRLGVIPGTGGAWLTQAIVGPTRAAEMLLTGELITAEQALEMGLVNSIAAPPALLDEARALASRITRHPRESVIANKRALVTASEPFLEAALQHAARVQPSRFTSEEFRRALRALRDARS